MSDTSWPFEFKRVPNRIMALHMIRDEGPISRADIARRLNLSRPTASRIIDALTRDGLIACVGKSQPTGGRLGDLYTFRADAGVVLGLELGTRQARAAMATLGGDVVHRAARPLTMVTRRSVLPQLRDLVAEALDQAPEPPADILSIGVAVPGVVRLPLGTVESSPVYTGLSDRPLRDEMERLFGVPVTMDNDVNFAALGEYQLGCARGRSNIAYLFVGRGIGAGLILNGQLFRGSADAAGEVGNMVVDRANLYERFGVAGCLEALAGIDRLAAAAHELGLPHDSTEDLCELAHGGDARACQAIHAMNEYVAVAALNLVTVVDPEIVVLGGDLAELPHAGELFARPIEGLMRRQLRRAPPVRLSQLQGDAALYGAVQAALGVALTAAGQASSR